MNRAGSKRLVLAVIAVVTLVPPGANAALCDLTDPVQVVGPLVRTLDDAAGAVTLCQATDAVPDEPDVVTPPVSEPNDAEPQDEGNDADPGETPVTQPSGAPIGSITTGPAATTLPAPGASRSDAPAVPAFEPGPAFEPVPAASGATTRTAGLVAALILGVGAMVWGAFAVGRRRGERAGAAQATRSVRSLERMKTQILANVGHELRTPLTSALGFARLVRNRELSSAQHHAFVGAIIDACQKLERVIDLLIAVATMEGGRSPHDTTRLDFVQILRPIAVRRQAEAPRHVIATRIEDELLVVQGNRMLLAGAVEELLDNAIKFSPNGGIVGVTLTRENGTVVLSVTDQGIGIDPGQADRLFEEFEQGDGSETRRFGGLGLGLAFVKRAVEAHGGSIDVASEPGNGSTFTVRIPTATGRVPKERLIREERPMAVMS